MLSACLLYQIQCIEVVAQYGNFNKICYRPVTEFLTLEQHIYMYKRMIVVYGEDVLSFDHIPWRCIWLLSFVEAEAFKMKMSEENYRPIENTVSQNRRVNVQLIVDDVRISTDDLV